MPVEWLIEDWLPLGHKAQDTAPEGSFKTIWGCYCAVSIATGSPILGHNVRQGPVLIIDEETPEPSLHLHLERFAQGLGFNNWTELPIEVMSMTGFRFGRATELAKIKQRVETLKPVLIRMDSFLAMLPSGRQKIVENDSNVGETVRDDLNKLLKVTPCSISLSAHSKKFTSELSVRDLMSYQMQSLVRGHGSIVGEGCDTGFVIKKISEHPEHTRFAIITKARRQAIPMSASVVYVEMREESYGTGWARLEEISPTVLPPSKWAKELFHIFEDGECHTAQNIVKTFAFFSRKESYWGVLELLQHNVILNERIPQGYRLNPRRNRECNHTYLGLLN